MSSAWSDERPARVLARLKRQSNYYNVQQRTVGDFFQDLIEQADRLTVADRLAWGQMRMDPTDLSDVTGYTYTFLVNGRFEAGARLRYEFVREFAPYIGFDEVEEQVSAGPSAYRSCRRGGTILVLMSRSSRGIR